MAKGERDWTQLDAFEAEYQERLEAEKRRAGSQSSYLRFLNSLAQKRTDFWADEPRAEDDLTGRLFALRGKILALREKVGLPDEPLLEAEIPYLRAAPVPKKSEGSGGGEKPHRIRFLTDPAPPGHQYPITIDEIKAVLAELPREHVATVHEIRLSNQKRTGADGDWLDGEIRLHCLIADNGKRLMERRESGLDVERFGGAFEWVGKKLYAAWPLAAYKTFVLRRVLIHEVAHGVAELPGYAEKVRRAGSVEKFCEQYAENFYRPPGKSVRLGF
ncbi:MAG: hypothetical protein H7Z41_09705 [Cytophagales bacterium]|nr:hypothetical protein [Armatimonadota bacterium]